MRMRFFPSCLAAVGLILGLTGCGDSADPRSVLSVVDINQNRTLKSDVVTGSSIFEDEVPVTIQSEPANDVVDVGLSSPYALTTLDRYTIHFEAGEAIPDVSGSLGWTVRTGFETTGSLVVVPAALKTEPVLLGLRQGGEITATAHVTFYGHESTSNRHVQFEASLPVHFANWAD